MLPFLKEVNNIWKRCYLKKIKLRKIYLLFGRNKIFKSSLQFLSWMFVLNSSKFVYFGKKKKRLKKKTTKQLSTYYTRGPRAPPSTLSYYSKEHYLSILPRLLKIPADIFSALLPWRCALGTCGPGIVWFGKCSPRRSATHPGRGSGLRLL